MAINLDNFVDVVTTRATRTASQRNFGIPLVAAYHTHFPERVRAYGDPADMVADGFSKTEAAYLAVAKMMSQSPRPPIVKVGRRAGAPTQTVDLTPSTPTAGEVYSVTIGGVTFSVTADSTPTVAEIVTALVDLMTADPDAVIASGGASSASPQTITTFNGDTTGVLAPPRNVTLVLSSHADWDATTAIVTGRDPNGRLITENFAIPNGGATTVVGTKVFASIISLFIPAQSGAGGTFTMGTGIVYSPTVAITATDVTTHVHVVNTNAGAWYAYTGRTANLGLADVTAEPTVHVDADLDAIAAADADWYAFNVADAQSPAQILDAAAWAESETRLYVAMSADTACEQDVSTDIMSQLLALSYFRTMVVPSRTMDFPDAAFLGQDLPGTVQFRFPAAAYKLLVGCVPNDYSTDIVLRFLGPPNSPQDGKRGLIYANVLPTGTNVPTACTLGGLTAGGEWWDVMQGIDYVDAALQDDVFNLLLADPKLPLDRFGIERLRGRCEVVLKRMTVSPNLILEPDSLVVEATAIADVSTSDRQARFYDGIRWGAEVVGAIFRLKIRGVVRP